MSSWGKDAFSETFPYGFISIAYLIVGSALQYMSFLGKDMFPITVSLTFPYGFISIVPDRRLFLQCHPGAKMRFL